MVRRQAAFHSTLVMCVSRSQKPMQSVSVLPPPPGALGADSLGLLEEPPGDSARLGWVTPPVANCVGNCGESGGIGTSSGRGAAIAGGGVTVSGGGGEGDVPRPAGMVLDPATIERVIRLMAAHGQTECHAAAPRLSAVLPGDGARFQGFLPPVVTAPAFVIRTKALRRLVTLHAVISFFFNTAVLALAINIGASLI